MKKIKVTIGDIFDANVQTIVNTVNCVGIMGKGIALEFKKHYPKMFKDYEKRCKNKEVHLGRPYIYETMFHQKILNFPTKDHWRSVTNLEDIIKGLEYLLSHYKQWGINSIAVPPLGCGHGQLEWSVVGPTLYRYLSKMDIPVELYAPFGTPKEELLPEFLNSLSDEYVLLKPPTQESKWILPAWVALVEILKLIEEQPYKNFVGRTIFQKIAYVATKSGLPTNLKFTKKSYGPFSYDLKKTYSRLINNGLIDEEQIVGRKAFRVKVGKTYNDAYKAYAKEIEKWRDIINKTADLFLRLNSRQAEIVTAVMYVSKELNEKNHKEPSEKDVFEAVKEWKIRRRPPLEEEEIAVTIRHLAIMSWLKLKYSEELPLPEDKVAYA